MICFKTISQLNTKPGHRSQKPTGIVIRESKFQDFQSAHLERDPLVNESEEFEFESGCIVDQFKAHDAINATLSIELDPCNPPAKCLKTWRVCAWRVRLN